MTRKRLGEAEKHNKKRSKGREGEGGAYISTSFSSLPIGLFEELASAAKSRKVFPRDLFSDAILHLASEKRRGHTINYIVPRKGGVKKTIWLSEEACIAIDDVSKKDNVSKNVLFLTALQLYSDKEGLNVKL